MTTTVLSPINIGCYSLPNRVVMAPLTRMRCPDGVANDLMASYYTQRASAGLIISEATPISPQGIGYPAIPCIYTSEQVQGWKKVTAAVHEHNGHIFYSYGTSGVFRTLIIMRVRYLSRRPLSHPKGRRLRPQA